MPSAPLFYVAALLSAGAMVAQVGVTTPPAYRGVSTRVDGVYVTPIPNSPLTALVDINSTRILPNGTPEMRKTLHLIARDSMGRIYNERRFMVPVTYKGDPILLSAHIFDPRTRLSVMLDPHSHTAREYRLGPLGDQAFSDSGFPPAPTGSRVEELGNASMSGVPVQGIRYTIDVPAEKSGTGRTLVVKDEYWYSPDLRLNMMVVHDDPRTGQQIVTITDVKRNEPDSKLFDVPASFHVIDETPRSAGSVKDYVPPSLH